MRYTRNDVKHELKKAKTRLKLFARKTGSKLEIIEDDFLSMPPKKAVEELKSVSFKRAKKNEIKPSTLRKIKVDDEKVSSTRIKKLVKKASVQEEQQKELNKAIKAAERRIANIERHTGLTIKLHTDYYNRLSHSEALKQLKEISYSNVKRSTNIFAHATVTSEGIHPVSHREYRTELTTEQAQELIFNLRRRERITGRPMHVNIYGESATEKIIDFVGKFKNTKQWTEHVSLTDNVAIQNYKHNMGRIAGLAPDEATAAAAELVIRYLNNGTLTEDRVLKTPDLHLISQIELLSSDIGEVTLKNNGEQIIKVLTKLIPIDRDDVYNFLVNEKGHDEGEVKHLLKKIGL